MQSYDEIIRRRVTWHDGDGFEPHAIPDVLFPFQRDLVAYACRQGRAALFADCGLGKTAMQLCWADNVHRDAGGRVLVVTPLAVAYQTEKEGERFGLPCRVSRDGNPASDTPITVTNYEQLHRFDPSQFDGVVCDESSAIKAFDGKRRQVVTDFMRGMRYRLLCTATAAPNDYHELGTSSEALGYLGFRDMVTKFFVQDTGEAQGWGRTSYRLRGWAERPFWRWVVSWARAIRKPSDLGYSDDGYVLPELSEIEHVVQNTRPRSGMLFAVPAVGLQEEREERRNTLVERCERMAELSTGSDPVVNWCQLNDEADALEKMIPDAKQVSGSMDDEAKEEVFRAFADGQLRVLVTKPKIGAWGLNWQHCNRVNTFPSHSFEQYYQSVRRCWRFGQERPVTVNIVTTEGESGVLANLRDKQEKAEVMFAHLVECMNSELRVGVEHDFDRAEELPSWL